METTARPIKDSLLETCAEYEANLPTWLRKLHALAFLRALELREEEHRQESRLHSLAKESGSTGRRGKYPILRTSPQREVSL